MEIYRSYDAVVGEAASRLERLLLVLLLRIFMQIGVKVGICNARIYAYAATTFLTSIPWNAAYYIRRIMIRLTKCFIRIEWALVK